MVVGLVFEALAQEFHFWGQRDRQQLHNPLRGTDATRGAGAGPLVQREFHEAIRLDLEYQRQDD